MSKKLILRLEVMKLDIGNQRNIWENLKSEINDLKPPGNYGTKAIDRAFTDLIASIDYVKFQIKG